MILTPSLNSGNYFSRQTRTSSRVEWRETWSFSKQMLGTHNLKFGSVVGGTNEHALVQEHPVDILDATGSLLERIDFTPGLPIARDDIESSFFAQDQWVLNSHVSVNLGLRASQQEVTDAFRLGPRAGLVWTPVAFSTIAFRSMSTALLFIRIRSSPVSIRTAACWTGPSGTST
jgi:outer membrane receptor protein involved in Fe transport